MMPKGLVQKKEAARRSLWARLHQMVGVGEGLAGWHFPPMVEHDSGMESSVRLADGLKIVRQYGRVLSGFNLADAEPLLVDAGLDATYERHLGLFQRVSTASGEQARLLCLCVHFIWRDWIDPMQGWADVCFELHQAVPVWDRGLTRHLLAHTFPGAKEYEVDVAGALARVCTGSSLGEWKRAFGGWRERGLVGVVLSADLLGMCEEPAFAEAAHLIKSATCEADLSLGLDKFATSLDWGGEVGLKVMGALEELSVRMGVKSNGPEFDLAKALKGFPDMENMPPHEVWAGARGHLEACFPPGALCPALCGKFKRASWGYQCLTPEYDGRVLRVRERSLVWLGEHAVSVPHNPALGRVPDVVSRLGSILLSPEFGRMMVLALGERITPTEEEMCGNPALLLHFMSDAKTFASPAQDILEMQAELEKKMPPVVAGGPVRLLGWRVDPPKSVVLYDGPVVGEGEPVAEPHLLQKRVLADERSSSRPVGGIGVLNDSDQPLDAVRRSLSHHVKTGLPRIQDVGGLHTALLEGLASFCLSAPRLHTEVALGMSPKWDNEHEDARYAETQTAANGVRHRDWVCVSQGVPNHKVRLEAHAIEAAQTFWTQFAWRRADESVQWVPVCSSVEPGGLKVLKERVWPTPTKNTMRKELHALLLSVKARFIQDLKLLPLREIGQRVDRASTSVYVDERAGQVLLAYAPVGGSRLEFLAFQLPI